VGNSLQLRPRYVPAALSLEEGGAIFQVTWPDFIEMAAKKEVKYCARFFQSASSELWC
jgi:hypothetical protein